MKRRTSYYRQGHNTRHAWVVGRMLVPHQSNQRRQALLAAIPTARMRREAEHVAIQLRRQEAQAAQTTLVFPERGTVLSGRYIAQREADGSVVFNRRRGVTVMADTEIAATFVAA